MLLAPPATIASGSESEAAGGFDGPNAAPAAGCDESAAASVGAVVVDDV